MNTPNGTSVRDRNSTVIPVGFFKSTKKFCKKHTKAILITAAAVAAVATIVIISIATGGAGAAVAAAAVGISGSCRSFYRTKSLYPSI